MTIDEINRKLAEKYGLFDGIRPNWRVVFSTHEREKRLATWQDRTKEGLFIREVTEVREVPKYWWCKDEFLGVDFNQLSYAVTLANRK